MIVADTDTTNCMKTTAAWRAWWTAKRLRAHALCLKSRPSLRCEPMDPIQKHRLVERSIGLFERLGGLDQRDELLVKDILRRNLLTAATCAFHRSTAFQ